MFNLYFMLFYSQCIVCTRVCRPHISTRSHIRCVNGCEVKGTSGGIQPGAQGWYLALFTSLEVWRQMFRLRIGQWTSNFDLLFKWRHVHKFCCLLVQFGPFDCDVTESYTNTGRYLYLHSSWRRPAYICYCSFNIANRMNKHWWTGTNWKRKCSAVRGNFPDGENPCNQVETQSRCKAPVWDMDRTKAHRGERGRGRNHRDN